ADVGELLRTLPVRTRREGRSHREHGDEREDVDRLHDAGIPWGVFSLHERRVPSLAPTESSLVGYERFGKSRIFWPAWSSSLPSSSQAPASSCRRRSCAISAAVGSSVATPCCVGSRLEEWPRSTLPDRRASRDSRRRSRSRRSSRSTRTTNASSTCS